MSAVLETREPSAWYPAAAQRTLVRHFDLLATAPGSVARLRQFILTLAVRGLLVPQDPADEPANVLLQKIRTEKDRLIAEGKVKQDKPLTETSEEGTSFQLPTGWEWVQIGNLLNRLSNGYSGAQSKTPSPYPLTRIETISAAVVNHSRVGYCTNLTPEEVDKYRLVPGDVLFSHINSDIHLGKTAIVEDDTLLIHGTNLLLLRPSKLLCARYINLAITQRRFDGYFLSIAQHAIGQASINQSKLAATLLALPPAAEQSRIVARVDELMQLCDALEAKGRLEAQQHARLLETLLGTLTDSTTSEELAANWQRVAEHFDLLLDRPEAVDVLEQTILQMGVRGLLVPQDPNDESASALLDRIHIERERLAAAGEAAREKSLPDLAGDEAPYELPKNWAWARLPTVYYSISPSSKKLPSSAVKDSGRHPVVDQSQSYISGYTDEDALLIRLPGPVIVFGDHTKNVKFIDFDFVPGADGTKILRPLLLNEKFFALQLRSFRLIDRGYARHFKVLNSQLFAVAPLAEQARIVARVTELHSLCSDLRQSLSASQATHSRLTEALVESVIA